MGAGRFRVVVGSEQFSAIVAGDRVVLADVADPFTVQWNEDGHAEVSGPDGRFAGRAIRVGDRVWVAIDGEPFELTVTEGMRPAAATAHEQDALAAPMAATVVRINVQPGSVVADGDILVALEAMKMELPIRAPRDGVVKAVHCRDGDLVQQGAVVVELEPQP
jgi:3-methylcrotonyl-CoA carboxylase alpha subunit